jgi:hypothetical protein
MSIKLTDTQLVLLGAAAQRKDLCLVAPPTLKGATAQKVASKLISAGLVKEVKAKASDPIWRRDEESGASYALKLTAAGAKAIAVDEAAEREDAGEASDGLANRDQPPLLSELDGKDVPERLRCNLTRRIRARRRVSNDDRDRASRGDGRRRSESHPDHPLDATVAPPAPRGHLRRGRTTRRYAPGENRSARAPH